MPRYTRLIEMDIGGEKVVARVCYAGRKPKPCAYCGLPSRFLCDYPTGKGRTKTCDRPLCDICRIQVAENKDYCPEHAAKGTP